MVDRYRIAAPIYDLATAAWSGGAIWRTRAAALDSITPDATVLVPGPGTGRLVAAAAALGAQVTAVEPSRAMRARLRHRLSRLPATARARVRVIESPLASLEPGATFHVVVAEHFLNVFSPSRMPIVRDALIARVRPGGALVIADFSPLAGPSPLRWLQSIHHGVPLGGCALLTRNALHRIYDHGRDLAEHPGLTLEHLALERSFGFGPRWFCAWTFRAATLRTG